MGMNCSFCATAGADRPSATSSAAASDHPRTLVLISPSSSVGKRPQTQLLLRDLPQSRDPMRLDDQKDDDQRPEADQLQLAREPRPQLPPHHQMERPVQEEREEKNER